LRIPKAIDATQHSHRGQQLRAENTAEPAPQKMSVDKVAAYPKISSVAFAL